MYHPMIKDSLTNKEEKMQKKFDAFFSNHKEETRKPYDIKKHRRSIYNTLCTMYKNSENKIDRDQILEKFVSEEQKNNFRHTNVYNKEWIIKIFKEFFTSQKKQWKNTWSVSELNEWNESLVITLSRKYWYQGKQTIDREIFIKEYNLDSLDCVFIRNAPIRTPIVIEDISNHIRKTIEWKGTNKRSPRDLYIKKPQYLKRLGKKYRDSEGKIDRLYILHKVFTDNDIIEGFKHRYACDRLLWVPEKVRKKYEYIDVNNRGINSNEPNPEDIYIEKEQNKDKDMLINKIYESMDKILSDEEKQLLFLFLEWDKGEKKTIEKIIQKIKDDLNLSVDII